MNKALPIAILVASLSACGQQPNISQDKAVNKANAQQGLSKSERAKAAKDDRGHAPMPMTEERLARILKEYQDSNNADDVLSWDEYNDWRRQQFDRTDANKNGTLDTEEYVYEFEGRLDKRLEEARKGQVKQTIVRFKALDKNEDKSLSWDEYAASGDRIFTRWDTDKDGTITDADPKPEYKSKTKDKAKKAKKRRRSAIRMPTTHSKKGMMKLYDANEDGKITESEFVNERRSVFHLADQDKSGELNQAEYLGEYEDRVDAQIAKSRRASIKQTYIRFDVLDDNKDKIMTFDELQISGKRIFNRWDKNQDGVISAGDVSASAKQAKADY